MPTHNIDMGEIAISLVNSFEDDKVKMLLTNPTFRNQHLSIFQTWHWKKTWWSVFGKGKLLLVIAERKGIPIAIAPLYVDMGMIFFVGSGGSDYLDFIGDFVDPGIFELMLLTAVKVVENFKGCRFYHVREDSPTGDLLANFAEKKNWKHFLEYSIGASTLEIKAHPDIAFASTRKKSLLRHEKWFLQNGDLLIEHLSSNLEIQNHLEAFFNQHVSRWEDSGSPSLFHDPLKREFYQRLVLDEPYLEWLRFTRIVWKGEPIAFHFGFEYDQTFYWYKPSFDISHSKHSPGEVLLRQLLLFCLDKKIKRFDFGIGEEKFKDRFSTNKIMVNTWGLYPN